MEPKCYVVNYNIMHELSLAMSVIELVKSEATQLNNHAVKSIEIEVGELAGVELQAFRFSMNAVLKASQYATSRLNIIMKKAISHCSECNSTFQPISKYSQCPNCQSYFVALIQGNELRLTSITVDEKQAKSY